VVRVEEHHVVSEPVLRAVREARERPRERCTARALGREHGIVRELAERDHDAHLGEQRALGDEIAATRRDLDRRRPVRRRRAARRGGHERVAELEPVIAPDGGRLVREAGAVERGVEPVAAFVAGEDPPGAVAAVGRGSEADDQEPRRGVAEAGHRPRPVRPIAEAGDLLARDAFAMRDEPRAEPAARDARLEARERVTRRRGRRQ